MPACDYGQVLSKTTSFLKPPTFAPWYIACIVTSNWLTSLSPPPFLHPCSPLLLSPFSPIPYLPILPKIPVTHHKVFTCYGPLVEDGYGIGFIPQDDRILFGISSFHHTQHQGTGSKQYTQKLRDSMREMHHIMVATTRLTSKLWIIRVSMSKTHIMD